MAEVKESSFFLKKLPSDVESVNENVLNQGCKSVHSTDFVESFLQRNARGLSSAKREKACLDVRYRPLHLDSNAEKKRFIRRTRKKLITAREKREFKIFDIPKEQQRYAFFEPLHDLWLNYIKDVIDFSQDLTGRYMAQVEQNLLKVDYHGCLVTVTKAACPSLIGHHGILLQETKNTWKIITPQDEVKVIPKNNTVVSTTVEGYTFSIQGSNFMFKTSERSSRKFKNFRKYPI